jgi:hypothetical protein
VELDLAEVTSATPAVGDPQVPTYKLHLAACPWPRVLAFSTSADFTMAAGNRRVGHGDLLSASGDVLLSNAELMSGLGIQPPLADLGLDAIHVAFPSPAGVAPKLLMYFSIETDVFSETLGPIGNGDLLSSEGTIARRNSVLLKAFSPMPVAADAGLDGLSLDSEGNVLFSVERGFFSETLGRRISSGDLLLGDGTVFKSEEELLAKFRILVPAAEGPGVDGVLIWPHGEVWFSTERGFTDQSFGPIAPGDLLSDTGRVVARNSELLGPFGPVEDLADFGLDALGSDLSFDFDDCGFLVQGLECVLFRADSGALYSMKNLGAFVPGDRVHVTGKVSEFCTDRCLEATGCVADNTIEPCPLDACGRLAPGPENCVVFVTDDGQEYVLENFGDFVVGDRVHVTGLVRQGCNSICVNPCVAVVDNTIDACSFEACGRLVEIGGCLLFETASGELYVIANPEGSFRAGEPVLVDGVLAAECAVACPGVADVKGCIEVESLNSIGEIGFFRRADCNADGSSDIADAVFALMYLFSSGGTPLCPESCNSNGDANLNLSDPVHTLNFLFTGGPSPPVPFPGCADAELRVLCGGTPCPCNYPPARCGAER